MAETSPTPAEQFAKDLASLQSKVSQLHSQVTFASLRDNLEDLETRVNGLQQRIKDLRARNYAFDRNLAARASELYRQWTSLRPNVQHEIERQTNQLAIDLQHVESQMSRLAQMSGNPTAARPTLTQATTLVDNLESKTRAAESTIRGLYDNFQTQANALAQGLERLEWMLQQLEEASFQLYPTEAGIMAVKAKWYKSGKPEKDSPEGVLFLTDQRLILEQKQEIATKKVLFITTEREKVQQLLFEVPLSLIQEITPSKQGLFKNEDRIEFLFASGAALSNAHLHLLGQDCNEWKGLINRAKSGEFDKDRAIAIDAAAVEKVKSAPTQCPNCSGALNVAVVRGMDSITCPYCGTVIRI
ncbi:MAG: hypothetical protein GYA59_14555 [Chloroflexi bacterium]|nr:hypothetical protein [Chloroflexota bacterium]